MSLGLRIRRFRENRGLTQSELGDLAGVTAQAVSSWETGVYEPKTENEEAISSALGISRQTLLFGPLPRPAKKRSQARKAS
jgi:transcriptional regulator with XRE-family HTH domain